MRYVDAPHVLNLRENIDEFDQLIGVHEKLYGSSPGRRVEMQVVNKSCIVLLLACWETFIEDMAENFFNQILDNSTNPFVFPDQVLASIYKEVKKRNARDFWRVSGDGWKDAFYEHKDKVLKSYIEKNAFNTPSPNNINRLFSELVGFNSFTSSWGWKGRSSTSADCERKLEELIKLRGSIAHRVRTASPVYKHKVDFYKMFILRLSVVSHNRLQDHVVQLTGERIWKRYKVQKTS